MFSQIPYPHGRITMQPRTSDGSASSAARMTCWYHSGKSSSRRGVMAVLVVVVFIITGVLQKRTYNCRAAVSAANCDLYITIAYRDAPTRVDIRLRSP